MINKKIINNKELGQLELYFDNDLVGRVEYAIYDEYIDFKYIFVNPDYRGQKIAIQLAQMAYDLRYELNIPSEVNCGVLDKILRSNEQFSNFKFK